MKLAFYFIVIYKIYCSLIVDIIVQHWMLFFTGRTSWA